MGWSAKNTNSSPPTPPPPRPLFSFFFFSLHETYQITFILTTALGVFCGYPGSTCSKLDRALRGRGCGGVGREGQTSSGADTELITTVCLCPFPSLCPTLQVGLADAPSPFTVRLHSQPRLTQKTLISVNCSKSSTRKACFQQTGAETNRALALVSNPDRALKICGGISPYELWTSTTETVTVHLHQRSSEERHLFVSSKTQAL